MGPGYNYGLGGTTYYGSGYSGYAGPGTTYFSTGTYVPRPYVCTPPVYVVPPVVRYRTYGYPYGYSGYGYRRGGLRIPFIGRRW